ncbi:MAG TPA: AbrB/MazE/SpoVT family DNA-binding domain-containing protein [Thermoanaerobaculia bacterium]|nr:AbrB/MazE/SpoVT family DNA-binding domain-containing protein [Thermoanaerobaculia bacterium]
MPTSTLTSDGQTTVPKEVREALHLEEGVKLTWEVRDGKLEVTWEMGGGKVEATTDRPAFWRWERFIKVGPGDVVDDVAKAREFEGRS